jgi:hypothetical protein
LNTFKDAVAALNLPPLHEISNGDVPFPKIPPEIHEARKQLTSAFGTYDKLATRIRDLPTTTVSRSSSTNGKEKSKKPAGTDTGNASQQRVQEAIRARAGLWLAEKMTEMPVSINFCLWNEMLDSKLSFVSLFSRLYPPHHSRKRNINPLPRQVSLRPLAKVA